MDVNYKDQECLSQGSVEDYNFELLKNNNQGIIMR